MLKVVAFVIFFAFVPDASSQESKNPRAKPRVTQDQRGTEQSPLVIKGIPAERPKDEADRDIEKLGIDREMRDLAKSNTRITWILLVIAAAQAGMFAWQLTLLRASAKTANAAATAALEQARAIRLAERAYVKLSHRPPGVTIVQHSEDRGFFHFTVEVRNYGRTPAHVTDVVFDAKVLAPEETLPDTPQYRIKQREYVPNGFLVTDDWFEFTGNFPLHGILNDVKTAAQKLYVFGYVDYIDIFGQRHRGGYARSYNHILEGSSNNLVFIAEKKYNYDRERKSGEGNDWNQTA